MKQEELRMAKVDFIPRTSKDTRQVVLDELHQRLDEFLVLLRMATE